MINVSTHDATIIADMRKFLEPTCEVTRSSDWDDFITNLADSDCSVLLLSSPPEPRELTLIEGLIVGDAEGMQRAHIPLVVVDSDGILQHRFPSRSLLSLQQTVVRRDKILSMLFEAMPLEAARAALAFAVMRVRSRDLPILLRKALLLHLRGDSQVATVKDLASVARCSSSSLRKYWHKRVSAKTRLEDFVDLVVLMNVRARKTPQLTTPEVAAEFRTTERHVQATMRAQGFGWPRKNNQADWLCAVTWFRQLVAILFPIQTSIN